MNWMPDLIRHDNRITKTETRRHKPKNRSAAAQTARKTILLFHRITKTEARRRKPPERQFYYSTIWFGRLRLLKHNIVTLPFNSAACAARLLFWFGRLRGTASVGIIARLGFCKCYRITKKKARRRKPKKQKRGGASRPKENFIIPPFDSAASAASRPRLDGCAARLLF